MGKKEQNICVQDCSEYIPKNKKENDALEKILTWQPYIFSTQEKADSLMEKDTQGRGWASRYIGEAVGDNIHLQIKPRFGEKIIACLLNLDLDAIKRLDLPNQEDNSSSELRHCLYKIMAFLWSNLLARANIYGLPRIKEKVIYSDVAVHGRLLVRSSLKSFFINRKVISEKTRSVPHYVIASILMQAYKILKHYVSADQILHSAAAKDAFSQFASSSLEKEVSRSEYEQLQYHYNDLDIAWKPVVDLSWKIIGQEKNFLARKFAQTGWAFFLDMALVWEEYLRRQLTDCLHKKGWREWGTERKHIKTYENYFFRREIIPDIVFEKDGRILVFDAKYKTMWFRNHDVDRGDFFQIHTYMQYFANAGYDVLAGGLLYPLQHPVEANKFYAPYVLDHNYRRTKFVVDGIYLPERVSEEGLKKESDKFCCRIEEIVRE